jgi:uncharacterized protein YkwD
MKKPEQKRERIPLSLDEFADLATDLAKEINTLRAYPQSYVSILEKDKEFFKENVLYRLDEDPLKTKEGPAAHDEAIEFLYRQKPVDEIVVDVRLSNAARDHVLDVGTNGLVGHEGSKKESVSDRVEKYAEWDYFLCQNIDFGARNVREIMITFLTGDGDEERSHRSNFFRTAIRYMGVYSGFHSETEACTSVVYAGNVRDLNSVAPEVRDFVDLQKKKIEDDRNKPKKIKTRFQIDDPDAPENAVSFTTFKKMKLVDSRAKHCTQRIYTLDDGTQHIVEVLEDLKPVVFKK